MIVVATFPRNPANNGLSFAAIATRLERFALSANALSLCFDAIPNGKPLRTFPGIALARIAIPTNRSRHPQPRSSI
ncbi:hypothetical protein FJ977_10940 [Mesorhizobium sp. B2-1-3A]|nr:hypothetical protein FJ977_10940 [Mesorhizobium sp. B2-1-3A]